MKKRKRRSVTFVCERHFGESVCRRSGEFAVAVIVEHFLQICASTRSAIKISIAFSKREVSVRPTRTPRIIIQIFLIFRDRQVVQLASEQGVGVIELTTVGSLTFPRRQL